MEPGRGTVCLYLQKVKRRLSVVKMFLLLAMFLPGWLNPPTQSILPQITHFSVDLISVTPDQAESGTMPMQMSWNTHGMRAGDVLRLEVLVLNQWQLAQGLHDLPHQGSIDHSVPHTLDFAPPTMRLTIFDAAWTQVATNTLVIPYRSPAGTPAITEFSADVSSVSLRELSLAWPDFRVGVNWRVVNRPSDTNLLFEQVVDDALFFNVEMPRDFEWVRSWGTGAVRPANGGTGEINLRLRLVRRGTGETLASRMITLPLIHDSPESPGVSLFEVSDPSAIAGEHVTLVWHTTGLASVDVQIWTFRIGSGPRLAAEYLDLTPTGQQMITMPDVPAAAYLIVDRSVPYDQAPNVSLHLSPRYYRPTVSRLEATPAEAFAEDVVFVVWETDAIYPLYIETEIVIRDDGYEGIDFDSPYAQRWDDLSAAGSLEFAVPNDAQVVRITVNMYFQLNEYGGFVGQVLVEVRRPENGP